VPSTWWETNLLPSEHCLFSSKVFNASEKAQIELQTISSRLCKIQSRYTLRKHETFLDTARTVQTPEKNPLGCILDGGITSLQANRIQTPRHVMLG